MLNKYEIQELESAISIIKDSNIKGILESLLDIVLELDERDSELDETDKPIVSTGIKFVPESCKK